MLYLIGKVALSAIIIVAIAEAGKRSSLFGAIIASVPLISVMALVWLYIDTKNISKVATLSMDVFWLVIPSLALFISLPVFLKQKINFYLALGLSITLTIICYGLMIFLLRQLGVRL